tara:strand:- start:58 stop:267 length:210 start_codon:yes stop_codon:yes gene_type:complete
MIVLKATQKQYKELEGYTNGINILSFAKDAEGNWIVGKQVLEDPAFESIHESLQNLLEIEYQAPPEEEE